MLKKHFNALSIRFKFIYLYLFIFLIPLSILSYVLFSYAYSNRVQDYNESNLEQFQKLNNQIQRHLSDMENVGNDIFYNYKITNIITKPAQVSYSEKEDLDNFTWITQAIVESRNGINLEFYVQDEKIYARTREIVFPISQLDERLGFDVNGYMGDEVFRWGAAADASNLSYIVHINKRSKDYDGYVVIQTDLEKLSNFIEENSTITGGSFLLLDKNRNILVKTGEPLEDKVGIEAVNNLYKMDEETFARIRVKDTKNDYYAVHEELEIGELSIIMLIPMSKISKESFFDLLYIIIILLLSFFICLVIANILSIRITKNIRSLTDRMTQAHIELFADVQNPKITTKDESMQLQQEFHLMINRMKDLIDKNYKQKIENQKVITNMMQMQINPHFLYNILDTINWIAIKKNLPEISDMVTDLAKFYRLGLSGGENSVTLESEVEHVKLYLKLQNRRFTQKINATFSVQESLYKVKTLKSVLQPIVENAIVHGIVKHNLKSSDIKIHVHQEESRLIMEVWNRGIDMDVNDFDLLKITHRASNRGFALYNVHNRILLTYGGEDGYGLQARIEDGWTKVHIIQPIQIL